METVLQAALTLASLGWYVFPLAERSKEPLKGTSGFKDATLDPAIIHAWFDANPTLNLGVAVGQSGLVVIDVDPDHGGNESWLDLKMKHGQGIKDTICSQTGGGGEHFIYAAPLDMEIRNNAGALGEGIDVRAVGGYIVVPPSLHPDGGEYIWAYNSSPEERQAIVLPPSLAELMGKKVAKPPTAALANGGFVEGTRNASMFTIASALRGRGLGEEELRVVMQQKNSTECNPPLPEDEVEKIVRSAMRYSDNFALTDKGNAERTLYMLNGTLFHSPELGWFAWSGKVWEKVDKYVIQGHVNRAIFSMKAAIANEADDDKRDALTKWQHQSEMGGHIQAAVSILPALDGVSKRVSSFDQDQWKLNVNNGVIDLCTGKLLPHDKDYIMTKIAPIDYCPDETSPVWDKFLEDATGGDQELIKFLQRSVGYSLTGSTREERLFFVHGPAATGKSTFLEAIKGVLGDYARTADFESFLKRDSVGAPRDDLAELAGARLVSSIEVAEGKALAEGLVKQMTGGDPIRARLLYRDGFTYRPQLKLWLVANDAPAVSDRDDAMWRRILRMPFDKVVPPEKRDPEVKEFLRDPERGGRAILAWAVRGCLEWQKLGLDVPKSVILATEAYRSDNDPLRDFVSDECVLGRENMYATRAELRYTYDTWCKDNGTRYPLNNRKFNDRIRSLPGVKETMAHGGERRWLGIGLRSKHPETEAPVVRVAKDTPLVGYRGPAVWRSIFGVEDVTVEGYDIATSKRWIREEDGTRRLVDDNELEVTR
jgi:putative DNA primase/helicase